jgi:hypothetical protein
VWLLVAAALSPVLGLLGTVTGMIAAFGVLSSSGMNQPTAITGGVAEALIATAAGLGIAIATLVPCNVFSAQVERAAEAMARCGSRIERLRAMREQDPEVVVVVSADGDVTHRRVVEAMDAARTAGIVKLSIAVQPVERR